MKNLRIISILSFILFVTACNSPQVKTDDGTLSDQEKENIIAKVITFS